MELNNWGKLTANAYYADEFSDYRVLRTGTDFVAGALYKGENSVVLERSRNGDHWSLLLSWNDQDRSFIWNNEGGGLLYEFGFEPSLPIGHYKIPSRLPRTRFAYYSAQELPEAPLQPMPEPDTLEYRLVEACLNMDIKEMRKIWANRFQGDVSNSILKDWIRREIACMPYIPASRRIASIDALHQKQMTVIPRADEFEQLQEFASKKRGFFSRLFGGR